MLTSSLSSLALWEEGNRLNSPVNLIHSPTFSGETKSSATLMQDCTDGHGSISQNHDIWSHTKTRVKLSWIVTKVKICHTFKFLTWWGHPAGMKTASPSFCSNVQGSIPKAGKPTDEKGTSFSDTHHSRDFKARGVAFFSNHILSWAFSYALQLSRNSGRELGE